MLQILIGIAIIVMLVVAILQTKKKHKNISVSDALLQMPKWSYISMGTLLLLIGMVTFFNERLINYWEISSFGEHFSQVVSTEYIVNMISFVIIALLSFTLPFISKLIFQKISVYGEHAQNDNLGNLLSYFIAGLLTVLTFWLLDWKEVMFFIHGIDFHKTESIHGLDTGFYVFNLPLISFILSYLTAYIVFTIILLISRQVRFIGKKKKDTTGYLIPFCVVSIFVPLVSWVWLQKYTLLITASSEHIPAGPGYITAEWIIPFLSIISISILLTVVYVLYSLQKDGLKKAQLIVSATVITCIGLFFAATWFFDKQVVTPDAASYEIPYIQQNMDMTKWAYDINVEKQTIDIGAVSYGEIDTNPDIVRNIRVHDFNASLIPMEQFQRGKPFYVMKDVDVDRYLINGVLTLVMCSLRELDASGQTGIINKQFKFTHGYGYACFPANEISEQGYPIYIAKDMPVKSDITSLITNQPRTYFSEPNEESQEFIFLKTKVKEYDYPSGKSDEAYEYEGNPKGAIKMEFFKSIITANKYGFLKIMLNPNINSDSYFVRNRNILKRAQKAYPFLQFDYDPLPVIHKSGITSILDAYITNTDIPYTKGYIRNSVKVTQDLYTGELNAYIADKNDPIIKVWDKIFPGLLKDIATMPEYLKSHLRYPEDLMLVQRRIYKDYHVGSALQFLEGNNKFDISEDKGPFFNLTKLPYKGFNDVSMNLISTMTYKDLENLSAILVGKWSEGKNKLIALHVNSNQIARGPRQFQDAMKSDEDMKKELALWGGKNGNGVIFGPIIPNILAGNSEDGNDTISMFYSHPIYVGSGGGKGNIPKITRVAVGSDTKVAWARNGKDALSNLLDDVQSKNTLTDFQKQSMEEYVEENGETFISAYSKLKEANNKIGMLQLLNGEEAKILESLK